MSASISANTASLSAPRTIPRTSGVGNGRLHNQRAGERPPDSQPEEEQQPAPGGNSSETQDHRSPRAAKSLEELFAPRPEDADGRRLQLVPKEKTPYSPEGPRKPQIDLIA